MSEYIINTFGIVQDFANLCGDRTTPLSGAIMDMIASRQREEIVRCEDCIHYSIVDEIWTGDDEILMYGCLKFEMDGCRDPDGFCAWGERKVVD